MSETLSACVIACDEEARLSDCLASLTCCDEIVVVDGGSRDRTREIARAAGARVVESPWRGFAAQRNVALDHARGEWVLEIDADERLSPALAGELRTWLDDPPAGVRMGALPMRDVFLGKPLGRSARYPRYRHRLFRRGAFRHDESRTVHEGLWSDGPTAAFNGEMHHLLASSWSEAIHDAVAYAKLEAAALPRPGPGEALVGTVLRPLAKLAYRLFLYGGWRDGWRGLARIWLDCLTDSLAVLYRVRNAGNRSTAEQPGPPRVGPPRLVGVAVGTGRASRLAAWLDEAADLGADVALLANERVGGKLGVPLRPIGGRGPGALARALDAEDQVRPIDALVLAGRRERLLLHAIPGALQGAVPPLSLSSSPAEEAVRDVQRRTRSAADLGGGYSAA